MLTPRMLSMGLRRAPGMIQGAARGAMQGVMQAPSTMREALMQQSGPQQGVAEILSQGLPEMMPDLGGATSAASRQRQIADMLLQGAQSQDNTSIAGGLSQLGQAFLARRAGQKADTAEDKQREMANLLLQQAIGQGPESQAARAQLFADNPAALIAQSDAAARQAVEDTRYVDERDYSRGRDVTEDTRYVDERDYSRKRDETADERAARLEAEDARRFGLTYGLEKRSVAAAEAKAIAAANGNRPRANDQNGVLRYLDGAQEPVFSNVEKTPKPLIGTETMARVATGLPNAKQAVANLRTLLFDSKGTNLSMEGYSPLRDVGAGLVQDVGHIPVIGGLMRGVTDSTARMLGGEDYQMFEDAYDTFEAAILPIMSGAAIPESEAKRQMQAVKIVPFDSKATKLRKLAAQDQMIAGLEMAANGDTAGFLATLENAGKTVAEPASAAPAATGGPPVGTVSDGFRFKGGNPNDRNSWEPV